MAAVGSGEFAGALRAAARRSLTPALPLTAADARLPDACFTGRPDRLAIWQALQAYSKWGWPVSEDKVVSDTTTDTVLGGEVDGEVGSVGSPMGRRFVLMILLLYASRLQWVSAYLVESLVGNVTFSLLFLSLIHI